MVSPEVILIAACVVLVLLPPRYDPAIRLKEWQLRRKGMVKVRVPDSDGVPDYVWVKAESPTHDHS